MSTGLVLYHDWGSTCSQKVRLALAEKGLDYEGRMWFIDLTTGNWALAGNPIESDAKPTRSTTEYKI